MISPYDAAGFTAHRLYSNPNQLTPSVPMAANPVAPKTPTEPSVSKPLSEDVVTREDLAVLKEEIKNEIKMEQTAEEKKKNKLKPIGKLKRIIGTLKKIFSTAGELTVGTFKGVVSGAVIGGTSYGVVSVLKKIPQTDAANQGQRVINTITNVARKQYTARVVGITGVAIGLGVQLWNASLRANEKRALIEHQYEKVPVRRK